MFVYHPESYEAGVQREWLIANGLGGYASSTTICSNTRAYHGLLIAAMKPPVERRLLLSSLDEVLTTGVSHLLSAHQYPGVIHPQGFRYLSEFRLDHFPSFSYRVDDLTIVKKLFTVHGENTTVISYEISGGDANLRIFPLITCRSFHAVAPRPHIDQKSLKRGVHLISEHELFLTSDRAHYVECEDWYYNFEYEEERRRGLPWKEDLLSPGYFEVDFEKEISFSIVASTDRQTAYGTKDLLKKEIERKDRLARRSQLGDPLIRLVPGADSFIVKRGDKNSIIAGYHWFDDWGRDAMISLPGLLLVTKRYEEARSVLKTFAESMRNGVLPNDLGAESYNTVDASLWFVNAVYSYWNVTEDLSFLRELWQPLCSVVDNYSKKIPGARLDFDGLIASEPGMTWMDARVDGRCVTPRGGKVCEINALWYSALRIMEAFSDILDLPWETYLADEVKKSYQKFWNDEAKALYDVVDPVDSSIRPNQIIAVAIPFDLLYPEQDASVVDVVKRELLTPYGLRTLARDDPQYIGRYEGSCQERDRAYHQGTVWPWLIGQYISALLKVSDNSDSSRYRVNEVLRPLMDHLNMAGINTISEIFDGDPPHAPRGCISQAWSVAETMRAWWEISTPRTLLQK